MESGSESSFASFSGLAFHDRVKAGKMEFVVSPGRDEKIRRSPNEICCLKPIEGILDMLLRSTTKAFPSTDFLCMSRLDQLSRGGSCYF